MNSQSSNLKSQVSSRRPVLVLGAGINGAAIARELALNQVPVCVVDAADLACGATSGSSRLIHGGLRYLEYGEFDLVRDALRERARLLRLAPHLVHPLRLYVPVSSRTGGLLQSAARFMGRPVRGNAGRGLWLVRLGLWLYDWYAGSSTLPRSAVHRSGSAEVPRVDATTYRWLCSYYDAQITYPERWVVAMLEDARQAAAEAGVEFQVHTYRRARLVGDRVELYATSGEQTSPADEAVQPVATLEPLAIINATGAWIDATLQQLHVPSRRLIGGTKGSHLVIRDAALREALAGGAIYAEARDGRPVFILPLADAVLVGTTDIRFEQPPEQASATEQELDYLLDAVHSVFPQFRLGREAIELHTCGVRPLPYADAAIKNPSAVTRRHLLVESHQTPVPLVSIVGGKLTTCRQVAEETTELILQQLGREKIGTSRERPLPGGNYDRQHEAVLQQQLASQLQLTLAQVRAIWKLSGNQVREAMLLQMPGQVSGDAGDNLVDTNLPLAYVRYVLRHEWVRRLSDVVERRLMLLYDQNLSQRCLAQLAERMVEAELLAPAAVAAEVAACRAHLLAHFGKRLR